ncbi:MlaD family protein [Paraconexibacter antarcticus]|uniref:MlaD family protein n=1 Tax=Paraconexibacter antarcticus TaxID=2949664 RepID=A0ABY5DZN0_9ACTN|nr:MlaD family protein [Paraconexibacter antarcticus]UTI66676.1 MlaD family protein [Paraconexibacter antarcticus]
MRLRRTKTRSRGQDTRVRSALLALAALVLVSALIFTPKLPFGSDVELRAAFGSAPQLRPGNPVRIAGLQVGEVAHVDSGPHGTSIVTMRLNDKAGAIHRDARVRIVARLILEGNFAVALDPGSPAQPVLAPGATIPATQTRGPVQLDQALDTFDAPTRSSLTHATDALATGLGGPDGRTGADGLRDANRELDAALGDLTTVTRAVVGRRPGDLQHLVGDGARMTTQLAADPAALTTAVTSAERVAHALVADDGALGQSLTTARALLRAAPANLTRIDAALPVLRTFTIALRPALRAAPRALAGASRLVTQLARLTAPGELPRLVTAASPLVQHLPGLERRLRPLLRQVTAATSCIGRNVTPTLKKQIPDGPLSSGRPVYQDLVHAFASASGANPSFDANGKALRISPAAGEKTVTALLPSLAETVTAISPDIQGTAPLWLGPGVSPPFRPDAPCAEQALPDLGSRRRTGAPRSFKTVGPATHATPPSLKAFRSLVQRVQAAHDRASAGR